MKAYRKLMTAVTLLFVIILITGNILIYISNNVSEDRMYLVEVSRLVKELENAPDNTDILSDCKYVKKITKCTDSDLLFKQSSYDYCIRSVRNSVYRFDYDRRSDNTGCIVIFNLSLLIIILTAELIILYIRKNIIVPFEKMSDIPLDLAKGNFSIPVKVNKSKYFGKYIWGINMLRDNINDSRKRELELQKDKNTLLLSLTHDIKTPLSVIKLNAQALQKGLYSDTEKQIAAAGAISTKVDEIEGYVSGLIRASKESLFDIEVKTCEIYLSDIIKSVKVHYDDVLQLNKTKFIIEEYTDCLLNADADRLLEVLQNLIENAIKYGDGDIIKITFGNEDNCCLIYVTNTGTPLDDNEIINLFDAFLRGSNSHNKPGSGLGLYICRVIMNAMNGDIFIKQNGNEFTVAVVVRLCG